MIFLFQENSTDIRIYLFGRTDREKEDWFRRLCTATHQGVGLTSFVSSNPDIKENVSETLLDATQTELEYLRYMSRFKVIISTINFGNSIFFL